jgi:hypothetical protein
MRRRTALAIAGAVTSGGAAARLMADCARFVLAFDGPALLEDKNATKGPRVQAAAAP